VIDLQPAELKEVIDLVQRIKAETAGIEVKAAHVDCPKKLYDTLSSFSNRDEGGILLFGLDEEQRFSKIGVYDAQDLMKKVTEQCKQMEPLVRPLFSVYEEEGLTFVGAEIPSIDITERPCYYKGKGIFKGSYVRVGDADEQMTDYEIYSFEAFRKKYADDIRPIERATLKDLSEDLLERYMLRLKVNKPNLAQLEQERIQELMSITRNREVTLSALLLFCPYPQAFCPQLGIIATVVPGLEIGEESEDGARFLDNRRIEGNIAQMLEEALAFVSKNMRISTRINAATGHRNDKTEYPVKAIRECVLNALVHRDYSMHTEGMPIQLILFRDRLEIINPGGLYGRIQIDQLGKVQADTRNPVLANAMETLGLAENRYSGIPTIHREMRMHGLPEPVFSDTRGSFSVKLFNGSNTEPVMLAGQEPDLVNFCRIPRSRQEIAAYLNLGSVTYAIKRHVMPLVEKGILRMTIPGKPSSAHQLFVTIGTNS
jgi:ATP-dependent DNA helicase RecG